MLVSDAQREVRMGFLGGFMGQLVSAALWAASAAAATWSSPRLGILVLVFGGFFIFPLTQLGLRALGRPGRLRPENPLGGLAMQVAFTLPIAIPVVLAATSARLEWFYPAFMVVLGAHYLPFVFLYGMRMFAPLAAALAGLGILMGLYWNPSFTAGAWITAVILAGFAVEGRREVLKEERAAATAAG